MKLVSYKTEGQEHLGLYIKGHIYNLNSCDKLLPESMNEFTRLEQYANLMKAPVIKFRDLDAVISSNIRYNTLPMAVRPALVSL